MHTSESSWPVPSSSLILSNDSVFHWLTPVKQNEILAWVHLKIYYKIQCIFNLNPRQKCWDTKQVFTMLIMGDFLPFLLQKIWWFSTLRRGNSGYMIQLKCPNLTFVWDCSHKGSSDTGIKKLRETSMHASSNHCTAGIKYADQVDCRQNVKSCNFYATKLRLACNI